ncbi:HAD-IB family phosphatase [Candidatus Roizmanbacteria bacterium]|nr:MAG: HAD-IB family phosphatase [Candidatus Roizmanbacteria bacterium]
MNVIFDFDGTIVGPESLPLLASVVLDGNPDREDIVAEIERITQMGMNNEIPFEESLARRLQLMRPHREHIAQATDILRQSVSPSLVRQRDFIRSHQNEFFVVSGGFMEIIVPIVDEIGFKEDHVFANTFLFDGEGFVTGCDTENPLSRSGGKAELIKGLGLEGQKIMIGDGYSDYEVFLKGAVDGIIISTEFVPPREFVNGTVPQARSFDEITAVLFPHPILERV